MPIAFRSPLPPPDGWCGHAREVKLCRGAACYGALAAHFGTDSPKILEWRVDRREPYDSGGDPSMSNKFRRWRQGKALPSDDTCHHVAERTGGSLRLEFWRDLTLWDLLSPDPPSIGRLHQLLEGSPMPVRRILFMDGAPDPTGRFHHAMLNREQTLAIRNQHSLGAFIALLCLARKAEALEDDPHHFVPVACAYDIFPRVLYSYRALRYRWETLFACMERIFWSRVYITGASYAFPLETVRAGLDALDTDPTAELPRMSGRRFRVIDVDPLERITVRLTQAVSVT
jgi:hypothetical protein